jgi:hypothetical protein
MERLRASASDADVTAFLTEHLPNHFGLGAPPDRIIALAAALGQLRDQS